MNIKKYSFLKIELPLILFFILLFFSINVLFNNALSYLEKKNRHEKIYITMHLLKKEKTLIQSVLSEYCHWDEFYMHLKNKDTAWINTYVLSDITQNYDYSLVYILDNRKNILLHNDGVHFDITKTKIFHNTIKSAAPYTGITKIHSNYYLLSASPVFDNLGTKKLIGYMFVAKNLSKENIKHIIEPVFDYKKIDLVDSLVSPKENANMVYIPLKNVTSDTLGFIKITLKENKIRAYFNKLNIILLVFSFIFLFSLVFSINKLLKALSNVAKNTVNQIDFISKGNYNIKLNSAVKIEEFNILFSAINNLSHTVEVKILENNKNYIEIIESIMAALEVKDSYTVGHSKRVAYYAKQIAQKLNLSNIDEIEIAALIHDIGKIGIPDSILNKPGKLTEEEFDMIKTHPEKSYKILEKMSSMENIKYIVKYHHERIDGKGYPLGLIDTAIPIESKIISVADAFDAMTSDRCYRGRFNLSKAMAILKENKGSQFDPLIVDTFIHILQEEMMLKEIAMD